jgi:hypothetical protein
MEMLFKTHFKLFLTSPGLPGNAAVPEFVPCNNLKIHY